VRNLNARGFEGAGSPPVQTLTRARLGPSTAVHLAAVSDTSATLAWGAPAHTFGPASYVLRRGLSPDNVNVTVADGAAPDEYEATDEGLALGVTYHYTLEACDLAGCGTPVRAVARAIGAASEVQELVATAKDADDAGLSWAPPSTLSPGGIIDGLRVLRYDVEVADAPDGPFEPLGSTESTSFNHAGIATNQVTFWYRVAAVVQQSDAFGAIAKRGTPRVVSLFFGTAPTFVGATPPDGAVFVAQKARETVIPLHASSPAVPAVALSFRTTGSIPSVLAFAPAAPAVDAAARIVSQNISVAFDEDLAGSEYFVCVQVHRRRHPLSFREFSW